MMIELQDWIWDIPMEDRHDVFLPRQLCYLTEHDPFNNFMYPVKSVIKFLDDQELDYCIHSPWPDGCSFYIMKPSDAVLIMFKFIFPEASIS